MLDPDNPPKSQTKARVLPIATEHPGPGERARPRALSGAPRARLAVDSTGLRPHCISIPPREARGGAPGAGALPGTKEVGQASRLPSNGLRSQPSGLENPTARKARRPRSIQKSKSNLLSV